jgi:aldehyde dehydrogenase (NAD+)
MNVTTRIPPPHGLAEIFAAQQKTALALRGSTAAERIAKLKKLEAAILAHQPAIYRALAEDLHKAEAESDLSDLMPVLAEIRHATRHLAHWMRPRRVGTTRLMLGTAARIRPEPRGVTLIISPWNYPVGLTLAPLVSAIAAGNTAMVKPSELSPATSAVLAQIIGACFEPAEVAVFQGDASVASALLDLPFDHMFFTGSPAIGRVVMAAAAKHLSSVTLELGGKSPAIVDPSANIVKAARSIVWGKFLNAGQTCIAPDHVFVHESVLPQFLDAVKAAITRMYGDAKTSPDYGRIINARHFFRLSAMLDDAAGRGAEVVSAAPPEAGQKFIAPTLLLRPDTASAAMQEEIFGPILPVIPYQELGQVIAQINAGPKPLALYVFGRDEGNIERVLEQTSSGGACVNLSLLQFTHANLPFGGVNNSGIGASHGEFGFRAFSHERAVLRDRFSTISMLFPPYTARVRRTIKLLVRHFI